MTQRKRNLLVNEMVGNRDRYIRLVCDYLHVLPLAIMSRRRDSRTAMARHIVMWALYNHPEYSTLDIGWLMGRNSSCVNHAVAKVRDMVNLNLPCDREFIQAANLTKY